MRLSPLNVSNETKRIWRVLHHLRPKQNKYFLWRDHKLLTFHCKPRELTKNETCV